MVLAQASSRRSASGRHTNNRRRLGVFSAPFASYGPVIEIWLMAGALRGWRLSLKCDCRGRSEEHTSELQSLTNLVCRLLLEKKKKTKQKTIKAKNNHTSDECA